MAVQIRGLVVHAPLHRSCSTRPLQFGHTGDAAPAASERAVTFLAHLFVSPTSWRQPRQRVRAAMRSGSVRGAVGGTVSSIDNLARDEW